MKLRRLSKKMGRSKTLGENVELDISWASGPGYRGGPENYFSLKVEAEHHDYIIELDVGESRRIKEQVENFLDHIDRGEPWWETGNYFKKRRT